MSELALLSQWVLAAVLAVSGVAKLMDRTGTADAMAGFGVPDRLRWAAPLLPLFELVVAALLVLPATARWGAFGALGLLTAFSAAIAFNLARGRRPDCNCFGRLGGGPIGRRTLLRNGVLMVLAAASSYSGATTSGDLLSRVTAPVALALAGATVVVLIVAGLGWLVIELWRQQARLLVRIDALEAGQTAGADHQLGTPTAGLPVGTSAPEVPGRDASGAEAALSHHWAGSREALLVFGDPACAACTALYPELVDWQSRQAGQRHVVVVSRSGGPAPHPDLTLFVEHERAASIAYGVKGTPSAVLVDARGALASPLAEGAEAIRTLLAELTGRPPRHRAAPVRFLTRPARAGHAMASFDLETFGARTTRSQTADLGQLLVFWNERCTHCNAMSGELQNRAAVLGEGGPDLTFVVTSRDQALATTGRMAGTSALLDAEMRLTTGLGVPGTPSAALVGPDGHLTEDLAVGPEAVLALLERSTSRPAALHGSR